MVMRGAPPQGVMCLKHGVGVPETWVGLWSGRQDICSTKYENELLARLTEPHLRVFPGDQHTNLGLWDDENIHCSYHTHIHIIRHAHAYIATQLVV